LGAESCSHCAALAALYIAQIDTHSWLTSISDTHIFAHEMVAMPQPETNRNKVVARLERDGWAGRHGGGHDVYKHPARPGRIIVPRHRTLSPGVARAIAKVAGWQG
jgi:predicted RNA binding protein YcfA (HicA-like mRNA interferase family)